jgi:hypothetical protein
MHTSSWSKIYTVAVAILASGQRLRENKGMMALRTLSAVDVIRCRGWYAGFAWLCCTRRQKMAKTGFWLSIPISQSLVKD